MAMRFTEHERLLKMLRSLLIKLSMLGVTLGAMVWIGTMMPLQHALPPPIPEVAAVLPPSVPAEPVVAAAPSPAIEDGPAGKEERLLQDERPSRPSHVASTEQSNNGSAPARPAESRRVDLNRASVTDLEALPGIGPKLAQRVVDHRVSRGPFQKVEDLQQVKGIGRKKFDRLRPFVLVTNTKVPSRR
jgi:competence protein ComEA